MVKYRIPYFDKANNGWRVELSTPSYTGSPVTLNTTQGAGCVISWNGSEDPTEPIIYSNASFTILKHNLGLINVSDFDESGDMDWSVDVYKNNALFWTGYLVPDGIKEFYESLPYDVELTAVDGLKLLQGKEYATNNWPLPSGYVQRSFISHVRDCLYMAGLLNKRIPIRWYGYYKQFVADGVNPKDAFTQTTYSPFGEGYTDFNGNRYSAFWVLENYLRAMECRLYQRGGKWIIQRIPDVVTGSATYIEMSADFNGSTIPTITTGTTNFIKDIGNDYLVDDGAFTDKLPGVRRVVTTYEANKAENSLPNGDFDGEGQFRWYGSTSDVVITRVASINGRAGYSAEILYPANSTGTAGTLDVALRAGTGLGQRTLPVDSKTMFKRFSFGFTMMPQSGFTYSTENGNIDFQGKREFNFRVECTKIASTNKTYTLNENGFWIPKPNGANFNIINQDKGIQASKIVIDTVFKGNVIVGDSIWLKKNRDGTTWTQPVTNQNAGNLLLFLQQASQAMQDASYGRILSHTVTQLTAADEVRVVFTINPDGDNGIGNPSEGTADYDVGRNVSYTNRDGSISLIPETSKIGDVIQVNFDKFQGIKIPDFADDPTTKWVEFNVFFYVNKGQKYTLDDVYFTFDENNEVYDYDYGASKYTEKLEYTLKISSSVNGIYTTNVATDYYTSAVDSVYFDSEGFKGTMTDIHARTVARLRSRPLRRFEGTLIGSAFNFGEIYTLPGFSGLKMLPLSASFNTETSETTISCVQLSMGDFSFARSFYGSNDKPLSNEVIN